MITKYTVRKKHDVKNTTHLHLENACILHGNRLEFCQATVSSKLIGIY